MAVVYTTALKNTRMDAVRLAIEVGGAGKLEIGTTGMAAVLATITLNTTPMGTVASGVLTFSGFPKSALAAAAGTAAAARIRTTANADVVTGLTVGTTATDVVLDSTTIGVGQTVQINSATLTHG